MTTRIQHAGGRADRLTPSAGAVSGVIGKLTAVHRERAERMAALAVSEGQQWHTREELQSAVLYTASAAVERIEEHGLSQLSVAWNSAGPPQIRTLQKPWYDVAESADACGIRVDDGGTGFVHGSVSGAQVLYVEEADGAVFFATRLHWLAGTADHVSPDWQSWSEILGFGAPLQGRTTVAAVRRLMPMQYVNVADGSASVQQHRWAWESCEPRLGISIEEATGRAVEIMASEIASHTSARSRLNPMLSGGRDSRMLTGLALRESADPSLVTAWTTSSDTGSALEELVAAEIAGVLGVRQEIHTGRFAQFGQDFEDYADLVDYQASFHVWLMPVVRALRQAPGAILDGIGGGVFFGGGFADSPGDHNPAQLQRSRITARSQYFAAAHKVLDSAVAEAATERARRAAIVTADQYIDHPNGHTLTSYLLRTVPGISLAPAKVLGDAQPTITPMISDEVVQLALNLPHGVKENGAWYSHLLRATDRRFDGFHTADDLIGTHHRKRRIASREGASYLAQLLLDSPVSTLLSPSLRQADPRDPHGLVTWQRHLSIQRSQHLIRGLGMMSLWLRRYHDTVTNGDPRKVIDA